MRNFVVLIVDVVLGAFIFLVVNVDFFFKKNNFWTGYCLDWTKFSRGDCRRLLPTSSLGRSPTWLSWPMGTVGRKRSPSAVQIGAACYFCVLFRRGGWSFGGLNVAGVGFRFVLSLYFSGKWSFIPEGLQLFLQFSVRKRSLVIHHSLTGSWNFIVVILWQGLLSFLSFAISYVALSTYRGWTCVCFEKFCQRVFKHGPFKWALWPHQRFSSKFYTWFTWVFAISLVNFINVIFFLKKCKILFFLIKIPPFPLPHSLATK